MLRIFTAERTVFSMNGALNIEYSHIEDLNFISHHIQNWTQRCSFTLGIKMSVKMLVSHIKVPSRYPALTPDSSFLLMQILGGSRDNSSTGFLPPCRKAGLNSTLLASVWPSPVLCGHLWSQSTWELSLFVYLLSNK